MQSETLLLQFAVIHSQPSKADLHVTPLESMNSNADARGKLITKIGLKVAARLIDSDKPFNRTINSLKKFDDEHSEVMMVSLLANRLASLPETDFYENVEGDLEMVFKGLTLDDSQREALNYLRKAPGPLALIQGPPGTGKSHTLRAACLPFMLFNRKVYATKNQVLLLVRINDPVTALARKRYDTFSRHVQDRVLRVIRYHGRKTEDDVVYAKARETILKPSNTKPEIFHGSEIRGSLLDMIFVQQVLSAYKAATHKPNGVQDARVTDIELFLGRWMPKLSDIEHIGGHPDCGV